ncbi:hypothetical protein ARMGADRAFT_1074790 [Armillaria gallica]|uniref:Retrotransposon gag domain-containing protein n=1 Tax=Armillaria gallica TaxID=47427 RepID=A0A2H3EIG1_ARMGA|nr:hypothetical protein ARMGADRAFT_1074790 [Armillaria gallica]
MEVLPEQGTPLSSFLPATPSITQAPLAIPPIQYDPLLPLMQQTWQDTSYDLAWARGSPTNSTLELDVLWDNINLPYTAFFPWLFAVASINDMGTSDQPQPPSKPQLPSRPPGPPGPPTASRRWALPRYLPLLGPPDPPAPWVLAADNQGPWAALKPNMVKEPENFNGDFNNIAQFFSYKDAQVWWELCARELGRNVNGDQIYPAYKQFVEEVRQQFWKDANVEIKHMQWERLQQSNFPDGDLFFQQFESLMFKAGVLGINQMMVAQVKKACCTSSKDTIYVSDGDISTAYPEWKQHILCIDYNWRMRKAETGRGAKVADWKQQAKVNVPMKGG